VHILIIRPGAIGDTLLTFPIIQTLRTHYTDSHITLVGNAAVLPLAFGLVEAVSDYGQLQWSELFSTTGIHTPTIVKQLQQSDLAICWLRDPDGLVEQNLLKAGVKRVIVAPGRPSAGRRIHVVDYLAETVGVGPLEGATHIPNIFQKNQPPIRQGQCVAIHPGSGGTQKCWPASSFAAVIEQLWQSNYAVLLLAGPADHERIEEIQCSLPPPPQTDMLNVLIDAPLVTVAEHIQRCKCYLGNDSGITHLAAMLSVPTIALFGPSDPAIWHPVGPDVEVIYEPVLEKLSVNMVIERVLRRL
jgi:hypothetical protein